MKLPVRQIAFLPTLLATPAFAGDSSDTGLWIITIFITIVIFLVVESVKTKVNKRINQIEAENSKKAEEFASSAKKRISEIIANHLSMLAVKHQQTNIQDGYGIVDISGWAREIDYFVEKSFGVTPSLVVI